MAEHCNIADCNQDAASSLGGKALCREHFISHCYAKLERYNEIRKGHGMSIAEEEAIQQFVCECSRQANEIKNVTVDLNNLERARLLDIIEEATHGVEDGCSRTSMQPVTFTSFRALLK